MITREEYNKALDVLEAYQKQLFGLKKKKTLKENSKTIIKDWVCFYKCSVRLQNVLVRMEVYDSKEKIFKKIIYIEDINKKMFLNLKHAGSKSWREFVNLRGY